MPKTFRVTLRFTTEDDLLTCLGVEKLIHEQWQETPAACEGDRLEIRSVEEE